MAPFAIHPGTQLGLISLTVSDLARALRFYVSTLGLKTLDHQNGEAVLGTDGGGSLIALQERPHARRKPPHTTGLYHFAILLPRRTDLARVLRRLAEQGYPLQGASDHGVSEALYLADPDGNGIEIYTDRPRDDWPWQNNHLQMFTASLDLEDLLNQVDSQWSGLPPATRIGHVHLHVADLSAAQSFYADTLGFDLMQRYPAVRELDSDPSALFLSAGGYHHHVGVNTWAGIGAPPPPPDAVGLRYFSLLLPFETELASVIKRLTAAGIPLQNVNDAKRAPSAFLARDPTGNSILIDVV
jgi:catechol 2,3-dioxygenase